MRVDSINNNQVSFKGFWGGGRPHHEVTFKGHPPVFRGSACQPIKPKEAGTIYDPMGKPVPLPKYDECGMMFPLTIKDPKEIMLIRTALY